MVKFDEFTKSNLKYFFDKRDKTINFDFICEEKKRSMLVFNKDIKYTIDEQEIPLNKIKELVNSKWVYSEAINRLSTLDANYKITWKYKGTNTIYFKGTKTKFVNLNERLYSLLNMINYIYHKGLDNQNNNEVKDITIYLILTDLKKNLDKDEVVSPKNINSGYTNIETNEILIWREEEFEKVIFHELIHFMELDTREIKFNDEKSKIKISQDKSYFEAFTDFWGILYHTIYLSFILKKSPNSLLQIEYEFIKNQANLMNNFFNLGDWTINKKVNQKSPAFSYFILKYLIFKKVIYSNDITLLNKPNELLIEILSEHFKEESFINLPPRMSLLQLD
jgi:hypothetical protein